MAETTAVLTNCTIKRRAERGGTTLSTDAGGLRIPLDRYTIIPTEDYDAFRPGANCNTFIWTEAEHPRPAAAPAPHTILTYEAEMMNGHKTTSVPNTPCNDAYVFVPKALLAEVLDTAESDNHAVETEFSCSEEESARYEAKRKKIRQLRIRSTAGPDVPHDGSFVLVQASELEKFRGWERHFNRLQADYWQLKLKLRELTA